MVCQSVYEDCIAENNRLDIATFGSLRDSSNIDSQK